MNNITSPALVFPNPEYRNLDQQKEKAKEAIEQIEDGQKKLKTALTALGILGKANITKSKEMPALGTPETSDEFDARINKNIEKAESKYKAGLKNEITPQSGASAFANLNGDMPSEETRYEQLLKSIDEIIAAINDITHDKKTADEIQRVQWLIKNLTPKKEELLFRKYPREEKY